MISLATQYTLIHLHIHVHTHARVHTLARTHARTHYIICVGRNVVAGPVTFEAVDSAGQHHLWVNLERWFVVVISTSHVVCAELHQ